MLDLTKLIEKYGPEITKSLGIASSQLYTKLLWYVRVDGLKMFILDIIYIGVGILFVYIAHNVAKRLQKASEYDKTIAYYSTLLISILVLFFAWVFICFVVIDGTVSDAIKFISPEYWIIDQIVQKSLQK